jgi:hypothetical protein
MPACVERLVSLHDDGFGCLCCVVLFSSFLPTQWKPSVSWSFPNDDCAWWSTLAGLIPLPAGNKSKAMTGRVMHAFTGTIPIVQPRHYCFRIVGQRRGNGRWASMHEPSMWWTMVLIKKTSSSHGWLTVPMIQWAEQTCDSCLPCFNARLVMADRVYPNLHWWGSAFDQFTW